jgi:broad specificity phosphatase PhoE
LSSANLCSAGIRDSELTNHGYQQAIRLGLHFKTIGLSFTHFFSSHLQRAAKTAGKIRDAQVAPTGNNQAAAELPEVVQLPLLVEKNFGSMEGKKSYERLPESKQTSKVHHRLESKGKVGFVDVESKDAMAWRADTFLDEHFLPLLDETSGATEKFVVIVSHGIFLSTLWKRLLLRLPANSVALSPELQATARPPLEHLGGWSNTGYLELHLVQTVAAGEYDTLAELVSSSPTSSSLPAEMSSQAEGLGKVEVPQVSGDSEVTRKVALGTPIPTDAETPKPYIPRIAHGWKTTILAINGKDHLKGMKRTGGGVGNSRHDASQKSIETFFKRRKVE